MKKVLSDSWLQLFSVYALFVLAIALGLFSKYTLQFNILGFAIGFTGVFILQNSKESFKFNKHYLLVPLFLTLLLRIIPYINNNILLGYDAGIYREAISGNLGVWGYTAMEPGFYYLMKALSFIPIDILLTAGLTIICVITAFLVYAVGKKYFDETAGLFSSFVYSISIIQLKAFAFMYYKNLLAFILVLIILLLYDKKGKGFLMGFLGAVHKATFFMFGLVYIADIIKRILRKEEYKKHIISGFVAIIVMLLFHIGPWFDSILNLIPGVAEGFVQPGQSPGTFISFNAFQFSILTYLPFAILGIGLAINRKNYNFIVLWSMINTVFVIAQFFFFNRFILHLDLAFILIAGYGIAEMLKKKNVYIYATVAILLLSGTILAVQESTRIEPLISDQELNLIKELQNTEQNAFVMNTDKVYSPWVLGYSERPTISPGLFDENVHNRAEWTSFWNGEDIKEFLDSYPKPLYIFIGEKQNDNLKGEACVNVWKQTGQNKIYQYNC